MYRASRWIVWIWFGRNSGAFVPAEVAAKVFPGWKWCHNFSLNTKGRIWIAWKPNSDTLSILRLSEQLTHYKVVQISTKKYFFISFVYGLNHEQQRTPLWQEIHDIAEHMTAASVSYTHLTLPTKRIV